LPDAWLIRVSLCPHMMSETVVALSCLLLFVGFVDLPEIGLQSPVRVLATQTAQD
jgi:ABC-type Fe3+ transport system permease subunit